MSKSNSLIKFLKNINDSINNLLEKNLNKLKLDNLINLIRSHKIILTFVALSVLFLSYLLVPTFFNESQISNHLKKEISEKYNLNLNFKKKLNYNFFPRPHFTNKETIISDNNIVISKVKKIKIYVAVDNLFRLKNIEVNDLIIESANFDINKNNYNFFTKLLDNNFLDKKLEIKKSNIFFRNEKKEVLFINQISNLKYFYDINELKNKLFSQNEIFNIPYSIEVYNNYDNKKIFSKLNLYFLKLQIENELDKKNENKSGEARVIYNKSKSNISYIFNKNFFEFNFYDKLENSEFLYNGKFNLNPFFATLKGNTQKINLINLLDSESFLVQLLNTGIFTNKNIDFELKVNAANVNNNVNFKNINLNSKIKEGLIDIDNTSFEWKNFVYFKIHNSLIFVKEGELILDGKLEIKTTDYNKIYKFLLTPKNYRNKFNRVDLDFSYNFNQRSTKLKDIKIDGKMNDNLNTVIDNINFKDNSLQNKIYIKNLLNQAIKAYAG